MLYPFNLLLVSQTLKKKEEKHLILRIGK